MKQYTLKDYLKKRVKKSTKMAVAGVICVFAGIWLTSISAVLMLWDDPIISTTFAIFLPVIALGTMYFFDEWTKAVREQRRKEKRNARMRARRTHERRLRNAGLPC